MGNRRYMMAVDLVDDPTLIQEYEAYHKDVWPAIKKSITDAGVTVMDIYRFGNRLAMIMEVDESFSFERKGQMDTDNPTVQEWEGLMSTYQRAIPGAKANEKWVLMDKIFEL